MAWWPSAAARMRELRPSWSAADTTALASSSLSARAKGSARLGGHTRERRKRSFPTESQPGREGGRETSLLPLPALSVQHGEAVSLPSCPRYSLPPLLIGA